MNRTDRSILRSPLLIAGASWLLPGLGYILLGERTRGLTVGITILVLFVLGLLMAGVRVIDVPGYDRQGQPVMLRVPGQAQPVWALRHRPLAEVANKPWFVGQVLVGPVCLVTARISLALARSDAPAAARARLGEIGTLYTAVAGMLNLLVMIDAAHRVGRRPLQAQPPEGV